MVLTKKAFFRLSLTAILAIGGAYGITAMHPAYAAENTQVTKVVASNGSQEHTYYVNTDTSAYEVKDGIEEQLKESNTTDDTTVKSAAVDNDSTVKVESADASQAEASGKDVQSVDDTCKDIVEDNAVNTTVVCSQDKVSDVIPHDTKVKKTSRLRKTVKKVSAGQDGKTVSTYEVTKKNGQTASTNLIGTSTIQPKTEVVKVGTGSVNVGSGKTFTGTSGKQIVKYAKKFVGNPYVYGGTSLTRGCDCSGFIYSVYRHFGLNVNRIPSYNGKAVSLSNLKPGDIIKYPGHFAMYAGNGKVVQAANYQYGIIVTPLNWGKHARAARRVVR